MMTRTRKTTSAVSKELLGLPEVKTGVCPPKFVYFMGRPLTIVNKGKDFDNDGEWLARTHNVHYREGQIPSEEADTILHELFHSIDHFTHLGLTERQIRVMATSTIAMLMDNPELLQYFVDALGSNKQATSKE